MNTRDEEQALRTRVAELESILAAVRAGEVDAVIGGGNVLLLRLREAEQALRESEAKYRQLFESMAEAVALHEVVCDAAGRPVDYRFLDVNPAFERQCGLPRDRVIGRTVREVFPGVEPQWIERYGRVALTGEPDAFEDYNHTTGRHYQVHAFSPAPGRFAAVFLNVTARRQAEEKLRRGERLYRALAANLPGGAAFVVDRDLRYLLAEGVALGAAGMAPGDLEGKTLWEALDPETARRYEPHYRAALAGRPFRWEHESHGRHYATHGVPLCTESGEVYAVLAVSYDITDRVAAERSLREMNETLEERVRRRTEQLRRLASELTETERREREKLAKTLHDGLQQTLVAAKMQLHLAAAQGDPEPLGRAERMLGEAIDTSRSLAYELSPPALRDSGLAEALAWLGRWFAENHGFEVRLEAGPAAPDLPDSLKVFVFQAVRELLLNAVKHSGVRRAEVRLPAAPPGLLCVEVADQGAGFDPAAADQHDGFGLFGLRERLAALGGSLRVEAAPGSGAKFALTFPVPAAAAPAAGAGGAAPAADRQPPDAGRGRARVLVVDDHKIVREGLVMLLRQQEGVEVIGEGADGVEAVAQVEALHPDVVVMDVNMPRMNGIEATRRIKEQFPRVRVIGLSLYEKDEKEEAMLRAGASAYLQKDGPSEDLIRAIRELAVRN